MSLVGDDKHNISGNVIWPLIAILGKRDLGALQVQAGSKQRSHSPACLACAQVARENALDQQHKPMSARTHLFPATLDWHSENLIALACGVTVLVKHLHPK